MKHCYIKTFGCQQNVADSEKIAQALESAGFSLTDDIEAADLIVINSCSVRQASEDKVYGMGKKITKLKEKNSDLEVVLTGCMVGSAIGDRRRFEMKFLEKKMPWIDEFITNNSRIGANVSRIVANVANNGISKTLNTRAREKKTAAYVPVSEGCDNFCSYCVVPYARGPERSRPMQEVIDEVKKLVSRGVKEITLLGQNVNSYGLNSRMEVYPPKLQRRGTNEGEKKKLPFVKLLEKLNAISELQKIHFLTSHPKDMSDQLINTIARLEKVEKYIHLPIQSGDNEILRKMNRGYTVKRYKDLIKKIRVKIPGVRIGTDVIVGFPGETREQFENTLRAFKDIKFDVVYAAMYSPRIGTVAYRMEDGVSREEKRRRYRELMGL